MTEFSETSEIVQPLKVERIERETGIRVPLFISRWPAIDRERAASLAYEFDLIDKEWLKQRYKRLDDKRARETAAIAGLLFCRNHRSNVDKAFEKAKEWEKTRPSSLELFERFLNPSWNKNQIAIEETRRRERRDLDILHLETDLLRKRGIEVPEFSTLLEYCGWVPESTGSNQKHRKWGWSDLHTAEEVYWDLMGHYAQIIKGARKAFDPLGDLELYLKGEKDITRWEEWDLQNMGEEDISYYSMSVRWGGGARTRSSEINFPERLVTHSTSLNAARSIVEGSYLDPRVCLSAGRVVSVRSAPEVTFIFDRQELGKVYSVRRYGEARHEKEVRIREQVHVGFAIGCVPTAPSFFSDYHGSGQGTTALGVESMQRWEKNFLKTGKLWSENEVEKIREIAGKHDSKER